MALEPHQTFRLVPRGHPGLTCDADGVALGGIPIAWSAADPEGVSRWQIRSPDEIGELLNRAYGAQRRGVVTACHRGLRRVASRLEAGDLALAGIEALMLRLPQIDAAGMAKLAVASELTKDSDAWQNQPRLPSGQPGGGQWTSGGSAPPPPATPGRSPRSGEARTPNGSPDRRSAGAIDDEPAIPETVATAPVAQSRRQSANGFYVNSTGGGVFFIPTAANGVKLRPTEVHALDASAFQVSWDEDGVISLKDANGTIVKVPVATPEQVSSFNATTGRALGVAIYTFPGAPLGSADSPPTAGEERDLAEARAAWLAGRQASEDSWSGRVTTGAVLLATALPFLSLAPAAAEAPGAAQLNTVEGVWPTTDEVGVGSGRATAQARPYEANVRAPYPKTTFKARTFTAVVNGERTTGVADAVGEDDTAADAKYVKNWAKSIRNPDSSIGKKPWATQEQERMVTQARKYGEGYKNGVVYHTNSRELALHYYRAFRDAGLTKFRFVITPARR